MVLRNENKSFIALLMRKYNKNGVAMIKKLSTKGTEQIFIK